AIRLKPDGHRAHWYVARVYQEQKKLAQAEEHFQTAVSLADRSGVAVRPEDIAGLYHQRARCYLQSHKLDAAMQDLVRAVNLLPKQDKSVVLAEIYADQGGILRIQKKYRKALAAYDAALRHRPDYREAHKGRGKVLLELRRNEE